MGIVKPSRGIDIGILNESREVFRTFRVNNESRRNGLGGTSEISRRINVFLSNAVIRRKEENEAMYFKLPYKKYFIKNKKAT